MEDKVIAALFAFFIAATMAIILALVIADFGKDARAISAGYQECQKVGSSGTVWQHECVFTTPGSE